MASGIGKTKARLTTDSNGNPIQGALRPKPGGSQNVDAHVHAHVSTRLVDANGVPYDIVRLISTVDAYIRFSDDSGTVAVATDMYLKAFIAEYFSLRGCTYIGTLRVGGADGVLNVQVMD